MIVAVFFTATTLQINIFVYFKELSITSKNYFIPYIQHWHSVETGTDVLEIGCGDGGNLLPFSEMRCRVVGVDIAVCRIKAARIFFADAHARGTFYAQDIFQLKELERSFDIIICHDVFEHIDNKKLFSHLPFVHLLPTTVYRGLLKAFGENGDCIKELLSIKKTRVSIESFESILKTTVLRITNRQLWLINPHYRVKFGLSPRKLNKVIAYIPILRNFFSTSCFYILKKGT